MNRADLTPHTLRIRVVNGKVEVTNTTRPAPDVEMDHKVEYLKVTADGLEYGNMNGMRPMGMIVNAGKRSGNVLEGTSGFRGIVLPLPGGMMPPTIYFRLEKR